MNKYNMIHFVFLLANQFSFEGHGFSGHRLYNLQNILFLSGSSIGKKRENTWTNSQEKGTRRFNRFGNCNNLI